ncbi:MAG: hypothetical protein ACI9SQ_000452 [Rubritalea sp.]|jgi:hypothetical protein
MMMSYELLITPSGNLRMEFIADGVSKKKLSTKEEAWVGGLMEVFSLDAGEGLFVLARDKLAYELPRTVVFWQKLAQLYVSELCKVAESDEALLPLKLDADLKAQLSEFYLTAPPMRGGEYLTVEVLEAQWVLLDSWVLEDRKKSVFLTLSAWLEKHAPHWHKVGRVCFHLAENKNDEECPFAFMATYAPRISKAGKVQYQPLGKALKEYAGERNKTALTRLLSPVQAAAEKLPFVAEMLDSGDVFYPLAWTPTEAYELLQNVPLLELSGLLVRLPNWWKKKAKLGVAVTIGDKKKGLVGAGAMLDFNVKTMLGDEVLSKQELQDLAEAENGLIFIKNQWVEVDQERLNAALDHWQHVAADAVGGVSFLEGMRLLAGAPAQFGSKGSELDEAAQEWSFIHAGEWLESLLKDLRNPDGLVSPPESEHFHGTLRPYQKVGKDWLYLLTNLGLGACLADDMGLGKTVQVISLLVSLKEEALQKNANSKPAASLLVLPATLLMNWKFEIEKFAPSLKVEMIHSSSMDKAGMERFQNGDDRKLDGVDLVLTTYGMVTRQKWLSEYDWGLVILDEAQAIKNPGSQQTVAVKQLKAKSRIALTGTPVENRLGDLWSLFDFLSPGLLGTQGQFKTFSKQLSSSEITQYGPLKKLISPYILRRLKTDKSIINDLPDKIEVKAYCGLSKKQAVLYAKSVEQLTATLAEVEGIKRRGLVLSYLMRFKQICNHPNQLLKNADYEVGESGKMLRLIEICDEIFSRQEKVLVFTQFREMTEPLADVLREIFGREGLVLHGGTSVKKRQQMVKEFQRDGGPPFFVLSLKAGGTGLTLTAASHVIHFDRWWNPAVENQATDRAFRIGQHRNVVVHKMICKGTIEEKIDMMLEEKANLADNLLEGAGQSGFTEMSDEDLLETVALNIQSEL